MMAKKHKVGWHPPQVNQSYPMPHVRPDAEVLDHGSTVSFLVYEIKNGYLLKPTSHVVDINTTLIYCQNIEDLTKEILSLQAQRRLNLPQASKY